MEPVSDLPKQESIIQSANIVSKQRSHSARILVLVGILFLLILGVGSNFPKSSSNNVTKRENDVATVGTTTSSEIIEKDPLSSAPKDVVSDLEKKIFPKTIGEYGFAWAYELPAKEGERSTLEVAYERAKPSRARLFIYGHTLTVEDIDKGKKDTEVKTYKQNKLYCDSTDEHAGCSWETEGDRNVITLLYSVYDTETKKWVDRAPFKYASDTEFVVLDWFLKQFPSK